MKAKSKYIVLAVVGGRTVQYEYTKDQKAEAVATAKNISLRADRVRLFSIDSEDDEIWYDLTNKI